MTHRHWGRLFGGSVGLLYVSTDTAGKTIIPAGSVVFPKRGGAIGTNKKRILLFDTCVDLNTMGVIPGKRLLTEYLFAYFQCLDLADISDGSTIPQINNKNVAPLQIPIPPISVQQAFSTVSKLCDKSKLMTCYAKITFGGREFQSLLF